MQKDAEDLRAQLQSVRAEMVAAAQRTEAERCEGQVKLRRLQSEADTIVCFYFCILVVPYGCLVEGSEVHN